jgi:hypothetical protein
MKNSILVINNNDNNKKTNLYLLFINWLFYLYNEFVKYLYIIFNPNYNEINKIRYIIRETNKIIVKLYKENIFNINQIFNLANFITLLIETNFESKSNSDKLYKAKNYFLLQIIFFILGESIIIIFNNIKNKIFNENENKYYIQKIFEFFDEFQKNPEINSQLDSIILVNYNFIPSLPEKSQDYLLKEENNSKIISYLNIFLMAITSQEEFKAFEATFIFLTISDYDEYKNKIKEILSLQPPINVNQLPSFNKEKIFSY